MVQFPKSASTDLELLQRRMSREKLARKEAERILEQKSLELYSANTALLEAHAALEKQVRALKVERDRVLTMSRTDFLTQLPNRGALLDLIDERLAARRIEGQHVWLFLVNLQHFQFINAALGPRGGDAVLRGVAERLHTVASRYSAVAGRFSGTEFAILLEAGAGGILDLGNEILAMIEQPILLDGSEVRVEVAMAAAGTNFAEPTTNALRLAADSAPKRRAVSTGSTRNCWPRSSAASNSKPCCAARSSAGRSSPGSSRSSTPANRKPFPWKCSPAGRSRAA